MKRPRVLTESTIRALWRRLGLAWLAVVLVVGVHQVHFWEAPRIESDVLALLPEDARDPSLAQATRRIADAHVRQMVVLLGAADAAGLESATLAWRDSLRLSDQRATLPFSENPAMQDWFERAHAFYQPWRGHLLTSGQRQRLREVPVEVLVQEALAALYSPMGAPRLTPMQADPLNLWPAWWQARAARSGLQLDADGLLHAEGQVWRILQLETRDSAFALDGERRIATALDEAAAAARVVVPQLRELRTGVPLYAEAAAVQASHEINLIGFGSLAGILLLTWLAFHSLRPILLMALSLLVGLAGALSLTIWVFGQVHLLTLVFGATLVGVAQDYGIHWFASRLGHADTSRWSLLPWLLPGMLLALATSVLAYFALGLAPFPGLRQMALFSVAGLAGAFATVLLWFPWLEHEPPRATILSRHVMGWLTRWPRLGADPPSLVVMAGVSILTLAGLWQLRSNDDLRSLQALPPELIVQQRELDRILGLPSPAQFYLVQAGDADTVLRREEALTARLSDLVGQGLITGYRAVSDWLPSSARQEEDAALSARVESQVLAGISARTGESLQRPALARTPLDPDTWLASPASRPLRSLWLGTLGEGVASVVMVEAQGGDALLGRLASQVEGLEGVRWINRTAEYSELLGHYRRMMAWFGLIGLVLVQVAVFWRYRGRSWRALAPTVLAGACTLALLGWLGQPLQLFNVLALLLLLGLGVDYGIFLLEYDGDDSAWLSVCIGAGTTWLSFGLLALSFTPALRAFGLTLLIGIALVWFFSPFFRPREMMARVDDGVSAHQ